METVHRFNRALGVITLATIISACGGSSAPPKASVHSTPTAAADKVVVDAAINDTISAVHALVSSLTRPVELLAAMTYAQGKLGEAAALVPDAGIPSGVATRAANDLQSASEDFGKINYCLESVLAGRHGLRPCTRIVNKMKDDNGAAGTALVLIAPYGSHPPDQVMNRFDRATGQQAPTTGGEV